MLEMSWIIAILQLYSQVADIFGNVIVKSINIRLFDLLARFHYILNLPRICPTNYVFDEISFWQNGSWTKRRLNEMTFRRNGFRRNVMDPLKLF